MEVKFFEEAKKIQTDTSAYIWNQISEEELQNRLLDNKILSREIERIVSTFKLLVVASLLLGVIAGLLIANLVIRF